MKKHKIDMLEVAVQDVDNIRDGIIKQYGDVYNANIVADRAFNSVNSLSSFPHRAQVRLKVSGLELRFLKSGRYTIVYCVNNNTVKIYGVFHSHRNIFELVKARIV